MSLQQDEDDDLLISPSTYTVTSPRRSPRKIQNSDRSSSTTSMTPLMSRTLLYGDGGTTNDDDVEDEEVHRATQQSAAAASAKAPVSGSKVFCDADNCPGLGHNPAAVCSLCEADLHMECFLQLVRKLKEYPEGCHDQVFCSDVCCVWHGNSGIDVEAVRKERKELQNLLKKQLVELARIAEVRVTQRLNKKSLQVSKAMMVRRLMAKKFNDLAGVTPSNPVPTPKPQKTVHARFRLINCIFSDDLSSQSVTADNVDRAALDAGAVGANSAFWKLCEERFNSGFPVDSIDGPSFADTIHFSHPTIDAHHETVNPSNHSHFSSADLLAMWKEIQKEYERVFINFKKSGNHNSSFTREAIKIALAADEDGDDTSEKSITDADIDDVFGVEAGGFCNFTNSIVIIYLRLWLNEKPGLTSFVSRELPDSIQIDSMGNTAAAMLARRQTLNSAAADSKMRKSPDMLADSINNLAKARKIEDGRREMHFSITKYHETETRKASIEAKREEIELVRHQLAVLTERYKECNDPEWKERYKKGLNDLEDKLDLLLMS